MLDFTERCFGSRLGLMRWGRVPMVAHLKNARAAAQIDGAYRMDFGIAGFLPGSAASGRGTAPSR